VDGCQTNQNGRRCSPKSSSESDIGRWPTLPAVTCGTSGLQGLYQQRNYSTHDEQFHFLTGYHSQRLWMGIYRHTVPSNIDDTWRKAYTGRDNKSNNEIHYWRDTRHAGRHHHGNEPRPDDWINQGQSGRYIRTSPRQPRKGCRTDPATN